MTQIKDASQLESMEQSIASLTQTITIIENHYKLKINEMENKVKDLQSGKLPKNVHFMNFLRIFIFVLNEINYVA